MKKLLIICGPTAVGKTSLALQLAKKFKGEIVSSDSRQIYRGMDIGTGKDIDKNFTVGFREKERIPVWLVDIVTPDYIFNAGEYAQLAQQVIEDIRSRKKLPIIVGGTGLYIKSLIEPLSFVGIPRDASLRDQLEVLERSVLAELLKNEDPKKWELMNKSDRLNPRRLIRAIEITRYQKKEGENKQNQKAETDVISIGLKTTYDELYSRIDKRVEERIKKGQKEEIQKLLDKGFSWSNSVLAVTIGYREWQDYFEKKVSLKTVSQKWKYAEHAYARRQMTWFKKQKNIYWFDIMHPTYKEEIEQLVTKWYTSKNDTFQSRNII